MRGIRKVMMKNGDDWRKKTKMYKKRLIIYSPCY